MVAEATYADLAEALLPAVLAAGRLQVEYQRSGVAVERKADASPVTIADRESEALLVAALADCAPDVAVVAEEAVAAGTIPAIGDRFFLVDALDGTKSFIAGEADFTINIGLVEGGRPRFGIVYAPVSGRLFLTRSPTVALEAGVDPFTTGATPSSLAARRIETRAPDPEALVAVASRSHGNAETEALLRRWRVRDRRNIGSSLKFCLVARGEADVYPRLGEISEWDTAAGDAVLRAAGGVVTLLDGSELTYGKAAKHFVNHSFIAWGRRDLATRLA